MAELKPYALAVDEGWTYGYGIDFTVKVGERRHGRGLAVVEYVTRAGEEPPDHTHGTEDELFYVLQGAVTFRCGPETFDVDSGGSVFLPRGIMHGYAIRSEGDVRLLAITASVPQSAGWGGFVGDLEKDGELRTR